MITQPNKNRNINQEDVNEFLADIHEFTKKWTLPKVSEKVFGISRQASQDRIAAHKRKSGGKKC